MGVDQDNCQTCGVYGIWGVAALPVGFLGAWEGKRLVLVTWTLAPNTTREGGGGGKLSVWGGEQEKICVEEKLG